MRRLSAVALRINRIVILKVVIPMKQIYRIISVVYRIGEAITAILVFGSRQGTGKMEMGRAGPRKSRAGRGQDRAWHGRREGKAGEGHNSPKVGQDIAGGQSKNI